MLDIKVFVFIIFSVTTYQTIYAQWCTQECPTKSLRHRSGNVPTPNPCSEQFELVTDLAHADCEPGLFFYAAKENCVHKCFPRCVEDCGTATTCNPNLCPPGYFCPNTDPNGPFTCQPDPKSCFAYHINYPNCWKDAWKPECLIDGTWKPKQCKGESLNGRCFCYDAVGNRIYGQEFKQKSENMTCACSRKRADLMSSGLRFYTSLHCDTMGNYEPLQCDNGQCWCVEPMTGEITASVVPEKMMSFLPCYSKKDIGEHYMRQCESEEFAQRKIFHELRVHGTQHASFNHIMCDADGTYGAFQIKDGIAYCKWKDNTNIGHTADLSHGIKDLNCNCARDKKIYELAEKTQNLLCAGNGNYQPQQRLDDEWYCVDSDGFRNSDYYPIRPDNCECVNTSTCTCP